MGLIAIVESWLTRKSPAVRSMTNGLDGHRAQFERLNAEKDRKFVVWTRQKTPESYRAYAQAKKAADKAFRRYAGPLA